MNEVLAPCEGEKHIFLSYILLNTLTVQALCFFWFKAEHKYSQ